MRISRSWLVAASAVLWSTAGAVERLPIEDFARARDVTRARLSPDGKHLAYVAEVNGRTNLHVAEPAPNVVVRLDSRSKWGRA